jgi:hypothetical protein
MPGALTDACHSRGSGFPAGEPSILRSGREGAYLESLRRLIAVSDGAVATASRRDPYDHPDATGLFKLKELLQALDAAKEEVKRAGGVPVCSAEPADPSRLAWIAEFRTVVAAAAPVTEIFLQMSREQLLRMVVEIHAGPPKSQLIAAEGGPKEEQRACDLKLELSQTDALLAAIKRPADHDAAERAPTHLSDPLRSKLQYDLVELSRAIEVYEEAASNKEVLDMVMGDTPLGLRSDGFSDLTDARSVRAQEYLSKATMYLNEIASRIQQTDRAVTWLTVEIERAQDLARAINLRESAKIFLVFEQAAICALWKLHDQIDPNDYEWAMRVAFEQSLVAMMAVNKAAEYVVTVSSRRGFSAEFPEPPGDSPTNTLEASPGV